MRKTRHHPSSKTSSHLFDATHGAIDLHDVYGKQGTLRKILASPAMQRLRRIKQLGFVSDLHPSAEHSRFGHSVGTMQVMRRLIQKDTVLSGLSKGSSSMWKAAFPKAFPSKWNAEKMMQHMLVAALLQDIGELPYGVATDDLIGANEHVFKMAEQGLGTKIVNRNNWSSKQIFAVASLFCQQYWFIPSDPYVEEKLYYSPVMQEFTILDLVGEAGPD